MSRQDKATTERNTKTLRELVKKPENKVCADCKKNDPRWASWNIGVFLCIRCSGIHRGMGTHISKVKSVDLDMWTPEQMECIQKWGNGRANLYWEAHLKSGHIPPDHKMEMFIRSKYESRRWALEGPPPRDPSVLERGTTKALPDPDPKPSVLPSPPPASKSPPKPIAGPSTDHNVAKKSTTSTAVATGAPGPSTIQNDLFNLDFHNPTSTSTSTAAAAAPQRDVKSSILSLYSNAPTAGSGVLNGGFGVAQPPVTSMMGSTGSGMWGAQSGWNNTAQPTLNVWGQPAQQPMPSIQGNSWQQTSPQGFGSSNSPTAQNSAMFGQNIWNGPTNHAAGNNIYSPIAAAPVQPAKKDDAFGDLWAGLK